MHRHELLAPAGSLTIAKAVLDAGADAVYLAGESFGARAYASNLSQEELFEILDYAHIRGRKIHLTVNTLLKNRELEEALFSYIRPVYEQGLDAVIVQDFGVLSFLHRNFPKLSLHASTQMSVSTGFGAQFLKDCGAERIVTARELTLDEIRAIHAHTDIEIESFVHGALCYCFSGQCLMSSLFGGRSGNRGRCAQPCRLPYRLEDANETRVNRNADYPLSPKDLCALDLLPDLCEAGVYSFKIEGRMKQIEYARGVTAVYRHYLDLYEQEPDAYRVRRQDTETLLALGNRSGFTKGYYQKPWGRHMLSDTDSSHSGKNKDGEIRVPETNAKKPKADMMLSLVPGREARLALSFGHTSVSVSGAFVQEASRQPLTAEDLKKRLAKTGDSAFCAGQISVELEGDCFLPVSAINSIRREGLQTLAKAVLSETKRTCARETPSFAKDLTAVDPSADPALTVQITEDGMLSAVLEGPVPSCILLDPDGCSVKQLSGMVGRIRQAGAGAGLCLPYCLRGERAGAWMKVIEEVPFDVYLARSYDGLGLLCSLGVKREKIRLDAGVYVFSKETAAAFSEQGISAYTMSYELNKKELRHQRCRGAMLSVYGRIPLMISAQCVYRNYAACKKKQKNRTDPGQDALSLKDRYGNLFFVDARCEDCYNIIYSNKPLYLIDRKQEISDMRPEQIRISFTTETADEIRRILREYYTDNGSFDDRYTRGHYNRGVE